MNLKAKQLIASALRDALMDDFDSARQRMRALERDELRALQRACMALQNLAGARLYASSLQGDAISDTLSNTDSHRR
ncbi:hypothetical protein [Alkalilimnicola sp. S0819]|uniref:hypothetical protein n=1 Tax=Alkalilimnicola sp. S0819 TaxID=2613922 RepID=UPI0012621D5C|nr:hypothetical protein [Alkalilimnicola sp. S0819]KAB7624291.1 hypothetical protein F3N43_05645 [Alkalilimnicola sp. S0819]MPQ16115.1 hypothetical protein [Alkalilimnicola sp. S0819]